MKGIHPNFNYEYFQNQTNKIQNKSDNQIEQSNLTNFAVYENVFTSYELKKIIDMCRLSKKEKGKVPFIVDLSYRSSNISWIDKNTENKWIYDRINHIIDHANNKFWKFNLSNKHEAIQFGEYNAKEKGHYDWHLDMANNNNNRKLSMSIQLSDPSEYTGGELQFLTNREIRAAPKKRGSMIIFPSYLLHKVSSVKTGKRMSLVMWRHGPNFK